MKLFPHFLFIAPEDIVEQGKPQGLSQYLSCNRLSQFIYWCSIFWTLSTECILVSNMYVIFAPILLQRTVSFVTC